MKKYQIVGYLIMASIIIHAETTIFKFVYDVDKALTPSELSDNQEFQLKYLKNELETYSDLVATKWIDDENVRILIQMMQLAVQQSPVETQMDMKFHIVKIFREFNIDIFFTAENFIEKVTIDPNETSKDSKKRHYVPQKRHPINPQTTQKSQQSKPLPRIHGARRTLKKVKAEWQVGDEISSKTFSNQATSPTPADMVSQQIWEKTMARFRAENENQDANIEREAAQEQIARAKALQLATQERENQKKPKNEPELDDQGE